MSGSQMTCCELWTGGARRLWERGHIVRRARTSAPRYPNYHGRSDSSRFPSWRIAVADSVNPRRCRSSASAIGWECSRLEAREPVADARAVFSEVTRRIKDDWRGRTAH